MKTIAKTALVSMGLVSVLGLTACQSTSQVQKDKAAKSERGYKGDARGHFSKEHRHHHAMRGEGRHGMPMRRSPMTAEQKQQFEKMQAERKAKVDALQQACDGKAGQTISVKIGEQTFNGKCQVSFRPDRPQPKAQATAITKDTTTKS